MIKKSLTLFLTLAVFFTLALNPLWAKAEKGAPRLGKSMDTRHAETFDVNRIDSWFINNGLFASDPVTEDAGLIYPKGSGHYAIFTAGLWLLGITEDTKELRACAADYSTDMQPGRILDSGAPDDPTKSEYIVYKLNKGESVPAAAIAQGAPAEVLGDQMLFCVYNDANPTLHAEVWMTQPIGVEIRQTVWGYAQAGPLGDACFMRFEFVNKGLSNLDSTYVALFFDPDLGDATDDYVACDTDLSLGFVYNGDAYDQEYGSSIPAIGCDFFQGPLADSPGDTAYLPSGVFPDKKVLPMTAFVKYINSNATYSDPDLQSANGGFQAYNYVQGFIWDGSEFIDPFTGLPSKFVNPGDPVTGTGWLGFYEAPPADHRMVIASGPFKLVKGQPMEVVAGLVAGMGNNNLNSVSIMKYNDKVAQFAYDNNFVVGNPPPQPNVTVFEGDQEIVLTWDETARDYLDAAGYAFEGYNVYQAPAASGDAQGKWKRIATFDKANYITKVYDEAFDNESDAIVTKPVQFGSDNGLAYQMILDKDYYAGGTPLVNGKNYYFAVTGYTVNLTGTPKALENVITAITCVPHKPEMKTELRAETAADLTTTIVPGDGASAGDITAAVKVVDPSAVTGHDYKVEFNYLDSGDYAGFANSWKLVDVTTGHVLINSWDTIGGGTDYPVVDGLEVKVVIPAPGQYGINPNKGTYVANGKPYAGVTIINNSKRTITGVNAGMETFFAGGGIGENFLGSTLGALDYVDVKLIITPDESKWSKAYVYHNPGGYAYMGVGTFPGYAEDISNPDAPRRLNLAFRESPGASNAVDMHWDVNAADFGDGLGGREYLFIMSTTYDDGAGLYYGTDKPSARNADVLYALWAHNRSAYASVTANGEWGIIWHCYHPVKAGDHVTFTTAGMNKVASDAVGVKNIDKISVFPNPYFGVNTAELGNFDQFVSFINLPTDECTIRVFTLSGQLIRTIVHDNGTSMDKWELKNDDSVPVGSGVFIVHIDVPNVGQKILKLAVVNREARYSHF